MNTDTDLHDTICETLPDWGPDVPSTPVAVKYPQGNILLAHAWADSYTVLSVDAGARFGFTPNPWDQVRITALLTEDGAHWPEVSAEERRQLGNALVGARAWAQRAAVVVMGEVAQVGDDGWMYVAGGNVFAAPIVPVRVHPDDLAKAREKAQPPLPEEPPVGSVVMDREGDAWQGDGEGWEAVVYVGTFTWADLHRKYGPVTVIHRAAP